MAGEMTQDEFVRRFVTRMLDRAGFEQFDDGMPVRSYAYEVAPTYWEDEGQREDGPEDCADADMSYWGEE